LKIVRKLAKAFHVAHQANIIHRDIKPDNIVIDESGEPVIMDFGLARPVGLRDTRITLSGMILGTPAYMSPEQVDPTICEVGPYSDVYSLGVVLYELLTKELPFSGTSVPQMLAAILTRSPRSPSEIRPDLDPQLEKICLKAVDRDPRKRYSTMAQFADALSNV